MVVSLQLLELVCVVHVIVFDSRQVLQVADAQIMIPLDYAVIVLRVIRLQKWPSGGLIQNVAVVEAPQLVPFGLNLLQLFLVNLV